MNNPVAFTFGVILLVLAVALAVTPGAGLLLGGGIVALLFGVIG